MSPCPPGPANCCACAACERRASGLPANLCLSRRDDICVPKLRHCDTATPRRLRPHSQRHLTCLWPTAGRLSASTTHAGDLIRPYLTPHTAHLTPCNSRRTPHTAHHTPHTAHRTPHTWHRPPHLAARTLPLPAPTPTEPCQRRDGA